jgi:hypothetical protein
VKTLSLGRPVMVESRISKVETCWLDFRFYVSTMDQHES